MRRTIHTRRRMRDMVSGFALAVALCLLVFAWHAANATPMLPAPSGTWHPYPGCVQTGYEEDTKTVRITWQCPTTPSP